MDPGGTGEFIEYRLNCDERYELVEPARWSISEDGSIDIEVEVEPVVTLIDIHRDMSCRDELESLLCHSGGSRWVMPECELDDDCAAGDVCVALLCVTPLAYDPDSP